MGSHGQSWHPLGVSDSGPHTILVAHLDPLWYCSSNGEPHPLELLQGKVVAVAMA